MSEYVAVSSASSGLVYCSKICYNSTIVWDRLQFGLQIYTWFSVMSFIFLYSTQSGGLDGDLINTHISFKFCYFTKLTKKKSQTVTCSAWPLKMSLTPVQGISLEALFKTEYSLLKFFDVKFELQGALHVYTYYSQTKGYLSNLLSKQLKVVGKLNNDTYLTEIPFLSLMPYLVWIHVSHSFRGQALYNLVTNLKWIVFVSN